MSHGLEIARALPQGAAVSSAGDSALARFLPAHDLTTECLVRRGDTEPPLSHQPAHEYRRLMLDYALSFSKAGESAAQTLLAQTWEAVRYLTPRLGLCMLAKLSGSPELKARAESLLAFRPTRPSNTAELGDMNLAREVKEISFRSAGNITVCGWYIPPQGRREVVVYCAGNHQRLADLRQEMSFFVEQGVGFLCFDYQGYGKSAGTPSQQGFVRNLEAALRYLNEKQAIGPERTIIVGNSYGSTVAVDVAARRSGLRGLTLISALSSLRDAFLDRLDNCGFPRALFDVSDGFRQAVEPLRTIGQVSAPLLLVHGSGDVISTPRRAEALFENATGTKRKTLMVKPGAGHADVFERSLADVRSEMTRLFSLV